MNIRGRKTKKCPRCGNVCLLSQPKCDDCGLVFSRLDEATNKDAKIRLKNKEKDLVIYVKKYPEDVKKWKMILLVSFAGLFGSHYFYVGRWKWGLAFLLYFLSVLFMGVVFNAYFLDVWNGSFFSIFGPITGIYTLAWLNDIRRVIFNRFPIPVSILDWQEKADLEHMKEERKNKKKKKVLEETEKEIVVEDEPKKGKSVKKAQPKQTEKVEEKSLDKTEQKPKKTQKKGKK